MLFEGEVKAVIELASFSPFSAIHGTFLDQLMESIGVVINMISANMRTEELLTQSQNLTQELQSQSKELTQQQSELKHSNQALEKQALELEDKARQLEDQNAKVEVKNREVEQARASLEEKAEQLQLISRYKSEFLANMSHELRTPLNSLLILAKLLADNKETNLSDKQVEYAKTIYASGGDLLTLINEILDLSKVEAGKMQVEPRDIGFASIKEFVERSFKPVADDKSAGVRRRARGRAAVGGAHRSAAPAAGAEEPPRQRLQVHRAGLGRPAHRRGRAGDGSLHARGARRAGAPSPSASSTAASASPRTSSGSSSRRSSRRTARRRASTAAPGWGCRSAARSRACSAARFT